MAAPDRLPAAVTAPLRRPIAVLVSRFPLVTETFILREIDELERQGQPVVLAPMITEHPRVTHAEARRWLGRALGGSLASARGLAAVARAFRRRPAVMLDLVAWILRGSATRPRTLVKSLALLPRAVLLGEELARRGVRHLHAHFATHPTTIALIISRLHGLSFSFTVHAHDIFVDRSLLREKLHAAAFVRSISRFNKAFLERLYPAEAAGKIEVVHVGIDAERFAGRHAAAGDPPRILCIAALKPYKGVRHLVEACRRMAARGLPFEADVIGAGPLAGELRRRIDQAGLTGRVRLLGPRPQHEVAEALREADLFVLPSVVAADGQMEGIPVALMEAMATGLAVVTTSISGIPELVRHGREGLLVDPGNPEALARAIAELLDDPDRRRRMGRAGRAKVRRDFALGPSVAALLPLLDRHNPPLEPYLEPLAGVAFEEPVGVRARREGPDALVLELAVGGARPRQVVLKRHVARAGESRPPQVRAAEEFALLGRVAAHMDGGNAPVVLRVPAPLAVDAEHGELLMAHAEGVDLETLLRRWRSAGREGARQAEAALLAAGAWLARFQTLDRGDGSAALARLRERAERALATAPALPAFVRRRTARRLDALTCRLAAAPPPAVSCHGDFWPGNLLVTADAVTVLDLEGYRLALAAEDLACLRVHLGLYLAVRRPRLLRLARRALAAGYGPAPDAASLELARRAIALELLAADPPSLGWAARRLRRALLLREAAR